MVEKQATMYNDLCLVTYDKAGKPVATTTVDLNDHHNFVYVRSADENLKANKAQALWIDEARVTKL
jgi:hypothetical protein